MRCAILILSILVLAPVAGAWQLPLQQASDGEWVVFEEDGWTHSKWVELQDSGLEPLRQISATEVLVWGNTGTYQMELQPVLRGPTSEGYLVVLEPRLPAHVQDEIISMFNIENLQFAGTQSALPTTFEVYGVNPVLFDSIPGIWWVEALLETEARNAVASSIMEHDSMNSHPVWDLGLNGTGVIIGVADSGIEMDHGCFRENATMIGDIGIGHRKVIMVNTTIDDGDYPGHSDYRHGTHIAGTLGCNLWHGNLTEGTSPSHGARILFQDVVNESGWSEPSVDWLLAEALEHGAVIHSDSWGDATEAYTLRSAEFDLWHREVPWSQAFIAPGNNPSKFYEPANARNVVAVGGSLTDNSSNLYSASSHGPTEEDLRGNFIVAPAVGIVSAAADGDGGSYNDDMRASTGTSMSTPLGASITAVIQQMVQDGWFTEDGFVPSGPMLRALLAMSAESMEGGLHGAETVGAAPDPLQGWGRPNLANLIDFNLDKVDNIWISDSYMMGEQERIELINSWLDMDGGRPLEQVVNSHWNGSGAAGPFLKSGESVGFELERVIGDDIEVFLSYNQRPFGTSSDNLDIVITLPNGAKFESEESMEGTKCLNISSEVLGAAETVWVEVVATHVGIGNHTGVTGSDGDMLGFGLAVKGVIDRIQPHIEAPYDDDVVTDSPELESEWELLIQPISECVGCMVGLNSIVVEIDGAIVYEWAAPPEGVYLTSDGAGSTVELWNYPLTGDFDSVELKIEMLLVGTVSWGYDWDWCIAGCWSSAGFWDVEFQLGSGGGSEHDHRIVRMTGDDYIDASYTHHTFKWNIDGMVDTDGDGYTNPIVEYNGRCSESYVASSNPSDCVVYLNPGADAFPNNPTQWIDRDGDGYGDNLSGSYADEFPDDYSQWNDFDGDGYGDNLNGANGDYCPNVWGNSTIHRYGCLDSDGDGLSDDLDYCPYEDGVAIDLGCPNSDNDPYADISDACPNMYGLSFTDRLGCSDIDGDGVSDLNDDFPGDPRFWLDTDGDGVADPEDLWPEDIRRAFASDSLEPGRLAFLVLIALGLIVMVFVPKKDDVVF